MNHGNLAYKLPKYEQSPTQKKKRRKKGKTNRRNRKYMSVRKELLKRVAIIAVMAISAGFMISQFVAVNEGEQKIASLRRQLAKQEADTSQMIFDMEQGIDLAEIEKQATTRLGMQRPEKYQTIYVNVKKDDMTEKTADEVESFSSRVMSAIKNTSRHILNFFSIK